MYDFLGYLSIVFAIFAFLTHDKVKMRFNGAISTLLFAISIFSYGGINGAFVSIISVITKALSLKYDEEKLIILKYLSFPISILFYFYFNEEGYIGLLPAISLIFIIFADIQKDIIKMKIIYYGSAISWLIYAILLNSIPAIIYDIVGLTTLTYSIYTLKKKDTKGNINN